MSVKKIFSYGALIVSTLFILTGIGFTGMYVLEAIIKRLGEADQSLVFWYLPFFFIGIFGILIGLGMGFWGVSHLKKDWD